MAEQPKLLQTPWAADGLRNDVPVGRENSLAQESSTYAEGFPSITMTPISIGGKPPSGRDMNGVLYDITENISHINKGGRYRFDATFAAAIGGYPKGAILINNAGSAEYVSLVDQNTDNFNASASSKWAVISSTGIANTAISAGDGLTGGGTLSNLSPLAMGTPSKITASSTNSLTSNSHTHEIDKASVTVAGVVQLVNDLNSTSTSRALTAAQGKAINDRLNNAGVLELLSISDLRALSSAGIGSVSVRSYDSEVPYVGGGRFYADASDTATADNGGTVIVGTDGTRWRRATAKVDVTDFGAKGDYTTDDTDAVLRAIAWAASTTKKVYIPSGVFRLSQSIDLPDGVSIIGDGSAKIAAYPQLDDNKIKLKPGLKGTISGSVLIFSGTASLAVNTGRTDKYATIAPCIAYQHATANEVRGVSIVQDMDVYTSTGVFTTGSNDNRAASYTAGYVTSSSLSSHVDFNIFGYFGLAGLVVSCKNNNQTVIDVEYPSFDGCLITGGTAIIGDDTQQSTNKSLTGLLATNSGFYGCDHHHRASGNYTIPSLYIDGVVGSTVIRGHSFAACNFRTYANEAIVFGRCNDVSIVSSVTEFATLPGVSGANANGRIVGSANTGNIRLIGIAATGDLGITSLIGAVGGKVQVIGGGWTDDSYFSHGGNFVAVTGDSSIGDSILQLSNNSASVNSGWTIRRDGDQSDRFDLRYDNASKLRYDLTANALTPGITDNFESLGTASSRWSVLYAGTAVINTSDERLKQDISTIPDDVIKAWRDVNWVQYRWIDAVADKGDGARNHTGLIAQQIKSVFEAHGLDAQHYGLLCHDQWPAQPARDAVIDDNGNVVEPETEYQPDGERWGIRMEECLALEAESNRRLIKSLASSVKTLEAKIDRLEAGN